MINENRTGNIYTFRKLLKVFMRLPRREEITYTWSLTTWFLLPREKVLNFSRVQFLRVIRLYLFIFLSSVQFLAGQSFSMGLDPNPQGQLSPWIHGLWSWSPEFDASLYLTSYSEVRYDESLYEGYAQAITNAESNYQVEINPLVWKPSIIGIGEDGSLRLGIGIGLHGQWWDVRETGYLDFPNPADEDQTIRLFFANNRQIIAIMPALLSSLHLTAGPVFYLDVEGAYIPYVYISIEHQLASAAAGFSNYDTPQTSAVFEGSSWHAWRIGLAGAVGFWIGRLDFQASMNGADYDYQSLGLGGGTDRNFYRIISGTMRAHISFNAIQVLGLQPQVGISWSASSVLDLQSTESEANVSFRDPTLSLGFLVGSIGR